MSRLNFNRLIHSHSCKVLLIIALTLFGTRISAESELSRQQIQNVVDQIVIAANYRNVDGVVRHLSPQVQINTLVNSPFGQKKVTLGHQQYQSQLSQVWKLVSNYNLKKLNPKISIAPGGRQASVSTEVHENFTINGMPQQQKMLEMATFELIDGRAMITAINIQQL